jgi:hypothetical protein
VPDGNSDDNFAYRSQPQYIGLRGACAPSSGPILAVGRLGDKETVGDSLAQAPADAQAAGFA